MAEAGATLGAPFITSLLGKVGEVLKRELGLSASVKHGIKSLKRELGVIKEYLEKADARGTVWMKEFGQIAHSIEDVLDKSEYKNAQENAPWHSKTRWKRDKENHSLDASIKEIQKQLEELNHRIVKHQNVASSILVDAVSAPENFRHGTASYFTPDDKIVGIKQSTEKLISWVRDDGQSYKEMFVVGMGGSGKTTLVKLVYERLKVDFNYYTWLDASSPMKSEQLLDAMFYKLRHQTLDLNHMNSEKHQSAAELHAQTYASSSQPASCVQDRLQYLRKYLQDRRYLIVLDDLWSRDLWENVKCALPNDKDTFGRVIITTQRGDIASSSIEGSSIEVYKLPPLTTEMAKDLFYRTAFPPDGTCHESLHVWSERILAKCEGLPLGIIEIGKLVSREEQKGIGLKKVYNGLKAELGSTGKLASITKRLLLSYDELPYHLKCCFQYTSMFSEDCVLKRTTLIKLWIAEGFISEDTGKQVVDTGEEYLKELIDRNLIQVHRLDFEGKTKTCKVHSLMHQIVVRLSESQNFCTIYTNSRGWKLDENIHRLSIQNENFNTSKEIPPNVRSLVASTLELKTSTHIRSSSMLLKILHLEGVRVETFPKGIKKLLLLKYLCLSSPNIKFIPPSIGRLQFLETFILKETFVTTLPETMANLEKLQHLVCYRRNNGTMQGFKVFSHISKLRKLQTLVFVKATNDKVIQDLGNLTQLRKLGILDLPRNMGPHLRSSIKMLKNLQSLNLTSVNRKEVLDIQEITEPPPHLQRVYLKGKLDKMPSWISNLHDLVRVRLQWSRLKPENNPLLILEDLRNLVELQLIEAYTGHWLCFNAGKFRKLNKLVLENMEELKIIEINTMALLCLKKLVVRQCKNLKKASINIKELSQLEELYFE